MVKKNPVVEDDFIGVPQGVTAKKGTEAIDINTFILYRQDTFPKGNNWIALEQIVIPNTDFIPEGTTNKYGATEFIQLTDVPSSYAGQAGKAVLVNASETGLEFVVSGASFITSVSDTNTIDLDVTASNLTANLLYIDSADIDFSDSGAGFTGVLKPTAVVAGTYGDATNVGQFTVDANGRLTSAVDVPITFPAGFITAVSDTTTVDLTVTGTTLTADVIDDSSIQKVSVFENGGLISTYSQINFVDTTDVAWTITDGVTETTIKADLSTPLSGFVPYTGATSNVTLGLFSLQASSLFINDNANNNTLQFLSGENLSADRRLTIVLNDVNRTLTIAANATISNTNTGDQTSIVGISGTMAQFDTACSDGNFVFQSQLGTGVATALAINVGSAGAVVTFNGALGTPSSGTATNITGLPIVAGTTGTLSVARGGTGVTTIAARSIWLANALDTITSVTPAAGQSIRINAGNTAWEAYTPVSSSGFATVALDNLASVAINTSLLVGTDDVPELGDATHRFHALHLKLASGYIGWGTGGGDGAIDTSGLTGNATMRFMNALAGYSFDAKIYPTSATADLGIITTNPFRDLYLSGKVACTTIELGAATDTTITRTGAAQIAVEGKGIITTIVTTTYITGSAATHNFQTGMVYCEVWCTGQGGGGGGARASDGSSIAGASGGGAGGTAYIRYNATEAGASATYTVGTAAGAGGSNVGGNGTAGANSTFDPAGTGATLTGTGGALGTGHDNATPALTVRAGGIGGVPTGGSLNISGGSGGYGATGSIVTVPPVGGHGGNSFWGGGGGATAAATTAAGVAATAYGAGGSGASAVNASAGVTGGNGGVGIIFIREYVQ